MSAINPINEQQANNDELQAAFQLFNQVSGQLEHSYRELEQRVEQLTSELQAARSEKLRYLADKERLADQLEKLLAAMPAAVLWIDQQLVIQSANTCAEELFSTQLKTMRWDQLIEQQDCQFDGHELHLKDGRVFSYNARTLQDNEGQVITLTDVTQIRDLQQTTFRQQRLAELGEMTAAIAHQVRTPLSSALLYASQISHHGLDHSVQQKAAQRIRHNLKHLEKLVNDMLLFARGGAFKCDLVAVDDLFTHLAQYFRNRHETASRSVIHIQPPLAEAFVSGSIDALLSVLISLVENAVHACDEQSQCLVQVEFYADESQQVIAVIDNGPGMSPAQCEQVFKPFFTTRKEGTGLGLAISQAIVKAHHGEISVKSEPGAGTAFYIQLPLSKHCQMLTSGPDRELLNHQISEVSGHD